MRNLKLFVSSLIAIVGMIIYIVTIPTIDEEKIVSVTAQSGDEKLLDEIYFSGYIPDFSTFYATNEEVLTDQNLSYLEQLDAPYNQTLKILQKDYPEFIDRLVYPSNIFEYHILNSENYLVSGHFEMFEGGYQQDPRNVYLRAMNKETNEMVEDVVVRENYTEGDRVAVLGFYEEYPVVKILYQTDIWADMAGVDSSALSTAEYNFETKNYSEDTLLKESGGFYSHHPNPYGTGNHEIQLFYHHGMNEGQRTLFVYNYNDQTLLPLEDTNKHYFIGENSQLFALEQEEDAMYLRAYNQTGEEMLSETLLEIEIPIDIHADYPTLVVNHYEEKLYIAQSQYSENHGEKALPTPFQVLDTETGDSLVTGEIAYDTDSVINATDGVVEEIGKISDN